MSAKERRALVEAQGVAEDAARAVAEATPDGFLRVDCVDWQFLDAWEGVSFDRMSVGIRANRDPRERFSSGSVTSERARGGARHRLVVTRGWDVHDARATLLHEMAHVATWELGWPEESHGPNFRRLERAAMEEVLGRALPKTEGRYGQVVAFREELAQDAWVARIRAKWEQVLGPR